MKDKNTEVGLTAWADELRRRYLRGEASVFVLLGNVHDSILDGNELVGVSTYLANTVLSKKDTIIHYNVSTGCRFIKSNVTDGLEELLLLRDPARVLPILERLLFTNKNVAIIVDYAEMVAPAGSANFFSEADRLAVVTFQRWSLSHELENSDSIVILSTDAPQELHPRIVTSPRVATVKVPMPDLPTRAAAIRHINPDLDTAQLDRFSTTTAGLRTVQLKSLLQPAPAAEENADTRFRFLMKLLGNEGRARKMASLTQGMSEEEISDLVGVTAEEAVTSEEESKADEYQDVIRLIETRKRELIERECMGLIEFVTPSHDFSVVGGIPEIKKELLGIADNIRNDRRSRVPMGLLFTGPMGTGKTFVAEAFIRETGLTGIKLKNFRSKWVGSTESNLEKILDVVKAIGNIVVIIDEADRSFGSGGEDDGGTNSRVVARLKEFMSDTTNRGRVLFILMSNRPDKLDIDIKRAGRLDRKIPFLYPGEPEGVELVFMALSRKHKLSLDVSFPKDRDETTAKMVGLSNADIEAIALLAFNYAAEGGDVDATITKAHLAAAVGDYLPSRDLEMLEFMELLAVFEASNRRMLPKKYAGMSIDDLQGRLTELKLLCAHRR